MDDGVRELDGLARAAHVAQLDRQVVHARGQLNRAMGELRTATQKVGQATTYLLAKHRELMEATGGVRDGDSRWDGDTDADDPRPASGVGAAWTGRVRGDAGSGDPGGS